MSKRQGRRLLIVDDDASIRAALAERLGARGYRVSTATDGQAALDALRAGFDLALLDLNLPRTDGLSVLRTLREEGLDPTVVVITAHGSVAKAVEAMRLGAYDFLEKPFEPAVLEEALRRASERAGLLRDNRALRGDLVQDGAVVADPRMRQLFETARRAAESDASVLLLGESGTGKEVLARRIHEWSARSDGPFVAVNCAALSDALLESELFGHEKGAFTGAHARHVGKLELAHGGTLFLDEIGDTTPGFQVKLLRALQERSFERVGGNHVVECDLRLLSATHRDLAQEVERGAFREDLYYRVRVIALELPPLRQRPADVPALAEHFLRKIGTELGRPHLSLSDAFRRVLQAYDWPGNARELRNAIERAAVLAQEDVLEPDDLPPELLESGDRKTQEGFHGRVAAFRRRLLEETLNEHGGNQTRAANALGLQRSYLARLIKKYGI